MRRLIGIVGLLAAASTGTGCVVAVRERRPPPPAACADMVWVPGHYGPRGAWHPGHYRCG